LAGVCMLSRFITGVFALQNDFENDGCSSVLTNHVGAETRFCFFRSIRDAYLLVYVCTYEH